MDKFRERLSYVWKLICVYFQILGTAWLLTEVLGGYAGINDNFGAPSLLIGSLLLTIIFILVDGFFINKFFLSSFDVPTNLDGVTICVKAGDILDAEGWIAVSSSEYFDTVVDNILISEKTLISAVIKRYWAGNLTDLDTQLESGLAKVEGQKTDRIHGKQIKYPIGTSTFAKFENKKFIFFALSQIDDDHMAKADLRDLVIGLTGMFARARSLCGGTRLSIPLVGSGLSKVGLNLPTLLEILLTVMIYECKSTRVTTNIDIVVPTEAYKQLNIAQISRKWSKNGK